MVAGAAWIITRALARGFFFRVGGAKRCTERDSRMLWGVGRGGGRPVPIRLLL